MPLGARPTAEPTDARLEAVTQAGRRAAGILLDHDLPHGRPRQRPVGAGGRAAHGCGVVVDTSAADICVARCSLIRDLQSLDRVVCGVDGVRVNRPMVQKGESEFAFMSAGVSTERRVELEVEELAWEMKRIKARHGKIVCVAGPVVIHTGGGKYLSEIIRLGYVQALLTGNALPTHDMELNLFGTSLGVDLARGVGMHGGHQHHLKAINLVRAAGSIRSAVEQGIITEWRDVRMRAQQRGLCPRRLHSRRRAAARYADGPGRRLSTRMPLRSRMPI